MKPKRAFCLFEQSGTFKNEFIKLGIPAEDYDILDDFGQTDHKADLFAEIDKAYNGDASLFDSITPEDLIIRKGKKVYKAIECRNWYTVQHGLTHFENNEINKETVLGVFNEFDDAARAVGDASQQFINKIKEGVCR